MHSIWPSISSSRKILEQQHTSRAKIGPATSFIFWKGIDEWEYILRDPSIWYVQCWFDNFAHVSWRHASAFVDLHSPICNAYARGGGSHSDAAVHAAATRRHPHRVIHPSRDFLYHLCQGAVIGRDSGKIILVFYIKFCMFIYLIFDTTFLS